MHKNKTTQTELKRKVKVIEKAHHITIEQTQTGENKTKIEIIKRIMLMLPSLGNNDWKTVKEETGKINV